MANGSRSAESGDDHSTNPDPPIHLPTPIKKIKKSKYQVMKLMALPECNQDLEALIRRVFREEFREELNQALRLHLPLQRSLLYEAGPSSMRSFKLCFDCEFPDRIFKEKKIEAKGPEGGQLLKVVLQDAATGHVISEGPLSSMRLEIVVLPGNFKAIWTEKEFNDNILTPREYRKPLLIGESHITLQNGVAFLENLAISDNSSWQSDNKFRLGVRVSPDQALFPDVGRVQEAVSKAFIVREKRCESYKKHDIPSLEDEVWRLSKIGKDGIHAQKLASNGIYTVKDLLQRYYTDPSSIRNILVIPNSTWDTILQHAQLCVLNNDHYSLFSAEDGFGLVFNCVLNNVGVVTYEYDSPHYWPLETLTTAQKSQVERLRRYAYDNQSQLVPTVLPAASTTIPFAPIQIQDQLQMGMNFGYPESTLPCHSLVEQSCHNKVAMNDQLIQQPILMQNGPLLSSPSVIVTGEDNNMLHEPMYDVSWLLDNFNY